MKSRFLGLPFTPLELNHRSLLEPHFKRHPQKLSNYTFASLFAWGKVYPHTWTVSDNTLLITTIMEGRKHLLQPIGEFPETLQKELLAETEKLDYPLQIYAADQTFLDRFPDFCRHFSAEHVPDLDNYVYRSADLARLEGRRYSKKRNLIAQGEAEYTWSLEGLCTGHHQDCCRILEEFGPEKPVEDLQEELAALKEMCQHLEALGPAGILIRINDQPAAFSIFDELSHNTGIIYFEKAQRRFKGLYQIINRATAKILAQRGYEFINRETDLGHPGLRQAKLSYYPTELVKYFILSSLKHLSAVLCLLFFAACGPIDPSMSGDTAPCPEHEWVPLKRVPKPSPFTECVCPGDCSPLLDICELVDIGLRNNPLTQQTWRNARAMAFNVGAAKAALYPTVQGEETLATSETYGIGGSGGNATAGQGGVVTGSRSRFTGGKQWLTTDVSLTYLLLDFGGRCAAITQAKDALWAANWTHNRMVQTVMVNVLSSYYNYVYALGLMEAREQDVRDAEKSLEAAKAQFDAGVATKVDLLQMQSLYVNAKLQLETARGQTKTTLGQLATAVGWPADSCIQIAPLPEELPLDAVADDMCCLLTVAKDSRPDLASAYAAYLESKAAVAIAESEALPTLTFASDAQRTDVYQNPQLNGSSQSAAITLNVPIFTGWLYENQIASAKETACSALAAWKMTELNVLLDVVRAYYAYTTAVESVQYSDEYLRFAQEAYDAALLGYRMGTNSIQDVLNAQVTLSNARSQWIQTRTQLFTSVANMAYAVGTL